MTTGIEETPPLDVSDRAAARRIGELVRAYGYTRELHMSNEAFQVIDHDVRDNRHLLAKHTPPVGKVECLTRAFLLDAPTGENIARQHLGDELVDLCLRTRLMERLEGGLIRGTVNLVSNDEFLLVSDHNDPVRREKDRNWVMGHSASSERLTYSMEMRPYGRMLDLCCGSGVQAFHMAPHAREIVAIDANERALNFGRAGAALNGFDHIEFRHTDLYSAVEGETFDLIGANPPFVVKGSSRQLFADGGMGADRFSEKLIREAGAHLNEGGFAHVISDVINYTDESAEDRLRGWVKDNGCDVLIFAGVQMFPPQYVDAWLSSLLKVDPERYTAERTEWLSYLTEVRVAAIQHHFVGMRKRTTGEPNWIIYGPVPKAVGGHYGHQVARLFRCIDLMRASDEIVLNAKLRVAPETRMTMLFEPGERNWKQSETKLLLDGGLSFSKEVPGAIGRFAGLCDGERTVSEILGVLAQAAGISLDDTIPHALPGVRDLLAFGYVAPAAD
ncbi:MAG: methyltransferase [Acidobacteria bacterium]|nr:methyltransferase [Acidobacteriota bacterium]